MVFDGFNATASTAVITNSGDLHFITFSHAGAATITTEDGGVTRFSQNSSGGDAHFITNAGGTFDISGLAATFPQTWAGSIEGAGDYFLGAYRLTVGSNGLSTEVSGVIADGGLSGGTGASLEKIGGGTLTLSGANTYTGGTTIGDGTLQLGSAGGTGAILGAVTVGGGAIFDVVNADTSGITSLSNSGEIYFRNDNTAGDVDITNRSFLNFFGSSTAGSATIINSGDVYFGNNSTAGNADITNDWWQYFRDASSAGTATITNNWGLSFADTSTAGNADITNDGELFFYHDSTAGSANITNNYGLEFNDTSTAGNATITNNDNNNGGYLYFNATSTAGSATITNNSGLSFYDSSTAGNAGISNNGDLYFDGASTAGSATITNDGSLNFANNSTAGSATIINSGDVYFGNSSTAGSAAIINDGSRVDFSASTGPSGDNRISAGSIAGAGTYYLGANELTVGSDNRSTTVSGVIADGGFGGGAGASLVKVGTGTLTLTGAVTYTGDTIVNAGTLRFGDGSAGATTTLAGNVTVNGGTLAIQAPATLDVAQAVTFADDTALSIVAGSTSPALSADSLALGNGVTFDIGGISDASQLDQVLIDTSSGIGGDFAAVSVGGFHGTVDYLTMATRKSDDGLQYLASYGLSWTAGNNLAQGTFTLTNATDSFTVGAALADQAANPTTGWDGTSLTKAGAGTLVLTGDNTYTGGTTIAGGVLSVSRDANLGATTGNLTFSGGTLATTASFTSARDVALAASGTLAPAEGTTLTLTGTISGAGGLILGSGTLVLSGTSSYEGGTALYGSTAQVSSDANLGASSGGLTFNGGTLATTASFTSARNAVLNAPTTVNGVNVPGNGTFDTAGVTTLTLAGVVSGAGALTKAGAGTLILNGANLYGGGTTVSSGTLVLGSSTAAGAGAIALSGGTTLGFTSGIDIANAIALNGNVTFDLGSGSATASGPLSGSGALAFTGGGLFGLTGDSSAFAGTTTVTGTLSINGTLGGSIIVAPGGTLTGNGTTGPIIVNAGGIIAPGNSPGTIKANGTVTFGAGSIYRVDVPPQGQHDVITATGAVTINNGASVQVIAVPGAYAPNTNYAILTTSGAVNGTFESVTSDFAFLTPTLSYDSQNVYLTLAYDDGSNGGGGGGGGGGSSSRFASYATSPNTFAVANAAQALGAGNPLFDAIVTLPVSGVPGTFDALSGEVYPSAMSVLQDESLILRRAVLDRARVPVAAPLSAPLAYAGKAASGADVVELPGTTNAFWAQGFGAWGRIDGNGNAATISGDTSGIIVGYDRTFSGDMGDWRLGFAAGYSSSSYQVDARSSSFSSDNAHVALYGGTNVGDWGIRFGGAYSWTDISASRSVFFPGFYNGLTSDTSASTGQLFGEVGYGLSLAAMELEPFAGLAYVNVDLGGFTERGGPAALTGYGSSEGVTYSTLGARISLPFDFGTVPAAFKGTLAWQHAFGDTTPEAVFAFGVLSQPFAISGVPIATDAALIEAGLDMAVTAKASLSVFYAGQLAETDTNNMVKGSFTLKF